MVSKAWWIRV